MLSNALFGLLCFAISTILVFAVVAVVGHGLWLMAAAIFAGFSKHADEPERPTARQRPRLCIGCGAQLDAVDGRCAECGLDPHGKAADELRDLEAAARTVQQLLERGQLAAETCAQIYKGIEARQADLLPRPRPAPRVHVADTPAMAVRQLEAWFGADLGHGLSVAEKKQSLGLMRALPAPRLRELSAPALVGMARLLASVGMSSRACEVYQVVFDCYAKAPILAQAAADALRLAGAVDDGNRARELVNAISETPGLLVHRPDVAELIEQFRARVGASPSSVPIKESAPVPVVEPLPALTPAAPIIVESLVVPMPSELPPPAQPRRSFAEWIAVFMEEKNILWGELIGGSLIVGCSIALVISLWQTLAGIAFFPFLILSAITSALFLAGHYTLHHWKLESTSRGLLLIGTLLVPLDFMVLAGLTHQDEGANGWNYLIGIAALALFAFFLRRSSHILIETPLNVPGPSAWLVTIAMLVSAAAHWMAPTCLGHAGWSDLAHYVLTLTPVLCALAALGWILWRLGVIEEWGLGRLVAMLIALGSVTFAACVTLSFPIYVADDLADALLRLSPAITLLGIPILLAGTLLHQKLAQADRAQYGLWRTLGTGLAFLGVFVMFGGFVVSVNSPTHRWLCGSINIGTLLAVAWVLRVPALHVPVQVYVAALLVFGWEFDLDAMMKTPIAGLRLSGLLLAQMIFAEALMRRHRRLDAAYYVVGAGVTTVLAGILLFPFAATDPGPTAFVLGVAALTWLAANVRLRFAEITYGCAVVLAAALFFGKRWMFELPFDQQLLWSLLTHATICLAANVLLRFGEVDWRRDFFRIPLGLASLFATFCATAVVIVAQFQHSLTWEISSVACAWLAALWLVIAVLEGWAPLFGAFQLALGAVWFFGASAWLTARGWAWLEPHCIHIHAFGLALMSLGWELARVAARSQPRVLALLSPPFVPIDRLLSAGLIVGQYALTVIVVLWNIGRELSATPDAQRVLPAEWYANAYSLWAWLLPIVLAGVLLLWLREFDLQLPVLGLTLLLLTIPLLAAGTWFDEHKASASAARWGLAVCYGIGSLLLWNRHRLGEHRAALVPVLAIRGMLFVGALVPVLLITLNVTAQKLAGRTLPGPEEGSVFAALGGPVSLLVPLAILSAALAGHGFRERLTHYLFGAGLLINASSVGAFFLALQRMEIPFGQPWVAVDALLLAAGLAWLWSIAWTWLAGLLEPGEQRPMLDSRLLTLNSLLGASIFGSVLVMALHWILFRADDLGRHWTEETGSAWGWLACGLTGFGSCFLFWKRRAALPLHLLGGLGLAALILLACSVEPHWRDHGFVALMLASGVFACVFVWLTLLIDLKQPPRWLRCTSGMWESVCHGGITATLAILMGCATFVTGAHRDWSASAVMLAAGAFALLAYQRKTELWATLASVVPMIASTILVLHVDPDNPNLVLCVAQTACAVLGAMSLGRLALHRFLAPPDAELRDSIQLPMQIAAGVLGNVLLLLPALLALVLEPDRPGRWLNLRLDPDASLAFVIVAGWLSLLSNAFALLWHIGCVRPRWVVHAVALIGLLLGVALAISADLLFDRVWLAHHVFTLSWTLLGLGLLIVSWVSHAQDALGPQFWPAERRAHLADFLRGCFPERTSRFWVTLCGAFVVLLALRASLVEPENPSWSIGNTLAVSVLVGTLAVWARAPVYVFGSGLLLNVVGLLIFRAWSALPDNHPPILPQDEWLSYFVIGQILCFGVASMTWSLIDRKLLHNRIDLGAGVAQPFTQIAIFAGIHVLAIGVALVCGLYLVGQEVHIGGALAWIALGVLAAAALVELWRPRFHRFTRYQLYTCGLMAIGLLLHSLSLDIPHWYLIATLLLAGYVLLIVVLTRLILAHSILQAALGQTSERDEWSDRWFWLVQLGNIGVVLALSLWITLTYPTTQERLGGALACLLVTVAGFLLVDVWPWLFTHEGERGFPRYLVLTLGMIVALQAAWACLDLALPFVWMQRNAMLFAIVALTMMIYRHLLPRVLPGSAWIEPGRSVSAFLGVLSVMLLLVLLGQELLAYDGRVDVKRTPLLIELGIVSGMALLGLIGHALWSALAKEADVHGIEGDWRSTYIYAMELLAVALVAHLRLNIPKLLPPVLGQYWYLSVMVLAFVGVALGEIFTRKNMLILAVPIKRSAMVLAFVPVLAFRLAPLASGIEPLRRAIPGLVPFLDYLERMGADYSMEALCWLLLGVFFGTLARLRTSANFGIAGLLAINLGVWVMLGHQDATEFVRRPQLWLIPLGLIVLMAEYVNRERLGFWPSLTVRYGGLLCIYLSSTIEMFVARLENPLLAIVLALLAVAGMLLGILFRVRAFLTAGFMALLTVIFAQIWHAAVHQGNTWVWWASGILLGVVILAMFALFEKHRNEVIKLLDNMKRWD